MYIHVYSVVHLSQFTKLQFYYFQKEKKKKKKENFSFVLFGASERITARSAPDCSTKERTGMTSPPPLPFKKQERGVKRLQFRSMRHY